MRIQQLTGALTPVLVLLLLVIPVAPQRAAYAHDQVGSESITHSGIGFKQPGYIAVDTHGNVYVSDQGNNRIVELMPSGKFRTLSQAFTKNGPEEVALDAQGNLYVVDQQNNRVQKLSPQGKVLGVWSHGLSQPTGIAVDTHGIVYVADQGNNRIVKLSSQGQLVAAWSTKPRTGLLTNVADVAVDTQGHVYVSEGSVNLIRELSSTGASLTTWQ
jgi:DNA-binding beta-propeller fold protein YncE